MWCNYANTMQAMTPASLHLMGSHGDTFLISFGSFLRLFRVCLVLVICSVTQTWQIEEIHQAAVVNGLFGFNYTCAGSILHPQLETLLRSWWYKNDHLQQLSSRLRSA